MAEEQKKGFHAELVGNDLEACCLGPSSCGECSESNCIIGYAKQCISNFKQHPQKDVPDGTDQIPLTDFKIFDEEELETAIAHILRECKDCKQDHTDNCIINVIRNCYEVGLFGDIQPYEGSTRQYLIHIKSDFPDRSLRIADLYMA